jgi:hypothetical protein
MTDDRNRCQSGVDFVLGFGVFFVTLSFVVVVIPELLSPFAAPEGPAVADRAVGTLAGDLLASGTVGTLNERCTAEFFDGSGASCSFDAADPTTELVGISEIHSVNVTLETGVPGGSTTEVVCYDGSDIQSCTDGGEPLARGEDPPSKTRSVQTASRVVRVDGQTLWLKLRVW